MPYAKITTETLKHGGAFDSRSLLQKKPKNDLEWIGELFADSKPLRTHSTNCLTHLAGLIGIARQMSNAPPCLRGESSLSRAVTVPIPAPPAPAPPPPPPCPGLSRSPARRLRAGRGAWICSGSTCTPPPPRYTAAAAATASGRLSRSEADR